jgi:hypothetical protein
MLKGQVECQICCLFRALNFDFFNWENMHVYFCVQICNQKISTQFNLGFLVYTVYPELLSKSCQEKTLFNRKVTGIKFLQIMANEIYKI